MNIPVHKQEVYSFWNEDCCGEVLYLDRGGCDGYNSQLKQWYELEPYILDFARFEGAKGKKVLEIVVGLGAHHQKFSKAGADLCGIDLTERAVAHTRNCLACFDLKSKLNVGDAERLPFSDEGFDLVYSWGVLHHRPDTPQAIAEVWRVLKRGSVCRGMIYHKWSMVALMLWVSYALLALQTFMSFKDIYSQQLESPGTKAYSIAEDKTLFEAFNEVNIHTDLTHGDMLTSHAGQRHQGIILSIGRKIWPRKLLRKLFPKAGLFMLIEVRK